MESDGEGGKRVRARVRAGAMDEALVEPRSTTTLWRAHSSTDDYAATFHEVGSPALISHTTATFVDVNATDPKFTVLHVIKQNGRYHPLVDGAVPSTTQHGGDRIAGIPPKTVHLLPAQTGLHVDEEESTNTVLSPCASIVTVEDGEVFPVRCVVRVWQQLAGGGVGTSIGRRVLTGDHILRPARMDDSTVQAVCTPFPLARSRKQRVVIYDQRNVFRAELLRIRRSILKDVSIDNINTVLENVLTGNTPAGKALFNIVSRNVARFRRLIPQAFGPPPEDAAANAADAERSTFLKTTDWLNGISAEDRQRINREQREAEQARQANADAEQLALGVAGVVVPLAALLIPTLFAQLGGTPLLRILGTSATNVVSVGLKSATVTIEQYALAAASGAITSIAQELTRRPLPEANKLYFTLDELASTLEVMGRVATLDPQTYAAATADQSYRTETAVWAWLMQSAQKASSVLLYRRDNTGFFSQSTIDTSELYDFTTDSVPRRLTEVETTISIAIEDPTICDGQAIEFDFLCNHDSAYLLALAGQGVSASVDRLADAIEAFQERLEEAARRPWRVPGFPQTSAAVYSTATYWWDNVMYSPYVIFLWDHVNGLKERGMEGLEELGRQRQGILNLILRNMHDKLIRQFVSPDSPGQRLKEAVDTAVGARIPPGIVVQRPGWVRTMPHVASSMTLLFPAPDALVLDVVEFESEETFIREHSNFKNAIDDTRTTFQRERKALSHLQRTWNNNGARLVILCGHVVVAGTVGLGMRVALRNRLLRPPVDAYSLVVLLPEDVRRASVQLDEATKRRMRFIADRRSTSAIQRVSKTLEESETSLIAVSLFSELWTSELVMLADVPDTTPVFVRSTLQSTSARAAERAIACADLFLVVTEGEQPQFFNSNDPLLRATLAGRDAARLGRRMRVDAVAPPVAVKDARVVAQTLRRLAKEQSSQPSDSIPSEPLQSLFMDVAHGHRAYQRALGVAGAASTRLVATRMLQAFAGAYPSLLFDPILHPVETQSPHVQPNPPSTQPARPRAAQDVAAVVRSLRVRMAKLQLDFPSLGALDATVEAHPRVFAARNAVGPSEPIDRSVLKAQTNELIEELSVWTIQRATATPSAGVVQSTRFSVPFGYGDAPPPLTTMPVSALGIGSVPVWIDDVRNALLDVLFAIDQAKATNNGYARPGGPVGAPGAPMQSITFVSRGPCAPTNGEIDHPTVIKVSGTAKQAHPVFSFARSQETLSSSSQLTGAAAAAPAPPTPINAAQAASGHLQSERTLAMSTAVRELVWNAERVLQCVLAAVAQVGTRPCGIVAALPDLPPVSAATRRAVRDLDIQRARTLDILETYGRRGLVHMRTIINEVLRNEGLQPDDADADSALANVTFMVPAGEIDVPRLDLNDRRFVDIGASGRLGAMPPTAPSLVQHLSELNLSVLDREDHLAVARDLPNYETALYEALLKNVDWIDKFKSDLADGKESQFRKLMREKLDDYRRGAAAAVNLQHIATDASRLFAKIAQIDLARRRAALAQIGPMARRRSKGFAQRTRITLAHAIGVSMAKTLIAPVVPTLETLRWPASLNATRVALERDRLFDVVERVRAVLQPVDGQALRLSELCAVLHFET